MILVVAATEKELAGSGGLVCGVGPVEAAARTAVELAQRSVDAVLHVGVAGARTFDDAPEWVIGSEAVYEDADDPKWIRLRVSANEQLVAAMQRALPGARVEPIGTSARVGGGSECRVEGMEGYAVLRAAEVAGVPAVEVRVTSNAIGEPDRAKWRLAEAFAELARTLPSLVEALDA